MQGIEYKCKMYLGRKKNLNNFQIYAINIAVKLTTKTVVKLTNLLFTLNNKIAVKLQLNILAPISTVFFALKIE